MRNLRKVYFDDIINDHGNIKFRKVLFNFYLFTDYAYAIET